MMDILDFIKQCPCNFLTVQTVQKVLSEQGYEQLSEGDGWDLRVGGKYFVTRNQSSLLAFRVPSADFAGYMIAAAHDESPSYKVKWNSEIAENGYVKLSVEPYGGMNAASWLDRPLSVAGRVLVAEGANLTSRFINIDRDLLLIPGVAVHLNRSKESGKLNPAVDMLPLYAVGGHHADFLDLVAAECGVAADAVKSFDLFLYNRMAGRLWGEGDSLLSAPRLDDLACVYAALVGFLRAEDNERSAPVLAIFDNEEVGSGTKQGACSTFLADTLERINYLLGGDRESYFRRVAGSFLISADNGHALHPNHPELADKNHAPILNGGIVIKHNAAQKYCTDGASDAMFRMLCDEAGVKYQLYCNRADIPGGSTLGNLSNAQVSLNSVDVGLAQLAMHSAYETMGAKDLQDLCRVLKVFFGKSFGEENGVYHW